MIVDDRGERVCAVVSQAEGEALSMRIIVHVDMDAFYAAVEERYNPALRGLPVAVGADPKEGRGRGVITTANYLARKYGIHSALPIARAWRLAEAARRRGEPATIFIRPNFTLYREVSARIMQIFEHSADAFEEASIDEAYLDVSSRGNFPAAIEHMTRLKGEIREKEETWLFRWHRTEQAYRQDRFRPSKA